MARRPCAIVNVLDPHLPLLTAATTARRFGHRRCRGGGPLILKPSRAVPDAKPLTRRPLAPHLSHFVRELHHPCDAAQERAAAEQGPYIVSPIRHSLCFVGRCSRVFLLLQADGKRSKKKTKHIPQRWNKSKRLRQTHRGADNKSETKQTVERNRLSVPPGVW